MTIIVELSWYHLWTRIVWRLRLDTCRIWRLFFSRVSAKGLVHNLENEERATTVTVDHNLRVWNSSLTLPDRWHEVVHVPGSSDRTPLDTRATVGKLEVGNVDVVNKFAASLESCISDHAPGIGVEDSTGHLCSSEDYSHCHGIRHGDPL